MCISVQYSDNNRKRYTFRKWEHLKSWKEFLIVYKAKQKVKSNLLDVYYILSPDNKRRVGFIIPKKIIRKAYMRNLIRRRLRDIYRQNKYLLKKDFHLVIQLRKDANDVSYSKLKEELLYLLECINGYNEN